MATFARYFDLVREMKNAYNHRLRLVESAKQRGIKPTARLFATTVPTVRKWLRRFQQHGPSGLLEHSRARHHQHHKTPATLEAQLVELRKTLQHFGARRLIREFRFRFPLSTASGSLRYLAPGSGLADRQWWRVQGGFPQAPRGQPARAHPARRAHLPKRRGNRSPPRRRRVLRSGKFRQPRRFSRQGAHLPALLQSRAPQLPQRKSEPLANHRAARSSLAAPTLLAPTGVLGLPPQRLRGIPCAQASLRGLTEGSGSVSDYRGGL